MRTSKLHDRLSSLWGGLMDILLYAIQALRDQKKKNDADVEMLLKEMVIRIKANTQEIEKLKQMIKGEGSK